MKTAIYAFIAGTFFLVSCGGSNEDTVKTTDAVQPTDAQVEEIYEVVDSSIVNWEGYKPTSSHTGSFMISEGTINENSNGHLDGSIIINMQSLQITDGTDDPKLKEHLEGADFFDVTNFPYSTFTITQVEQQYGDSSFVSGNLELKGVSKNITFPALITMEDSSMTIQADFFINREDWNMHYGNDKSLKDKFIKPDVRLFFNIRANKVAAP